MVLCRTAEFRLPLLLPLYVRAILPKACVTRKEEDQHEIGCRHVVQVSGSSRRDSVGPERKRLTLALNAFHRRLESECHSNTTLSTMCLSMETLEDGKCLHDFIVRHGLEQDLLFVNNLLRIYVKCDSLLEASQVFHKMPRRNVVSWTTMIAGYAQHRNSEEAFEFFHKMQKEGVKPNKVTFISLLYGCDNPAFLSNGQLVHFHVMDNGLDSHVVVGTALIKMYSNCSSIEDVRHMFHNIADRDVVAWTTIIAAHVKHGHSKRAWGLFQQMHQEGVKPNHYTFNIILNACAHLEALAEGEKIHACIAKTGFEGDLFVGNALLDMYSKCGSIEFACQLFKQMPNRDVVSWNAILAGLAQHGNWQEALEHFEHMKQDGLNPDQFTFSCVLSICTNLKDLSLGKKVHHQVKQAGFESEVVVVNALIDMYAKCGSMEEARELFDKMNTRDEVSWTTMVTGCVRHEFGNEALELFDHMPKRDVSSWTAMIQGYTQRGHHEEALKLFQQMQLEGVKPNHFTFGTVLSACAGLSDLNQGRHVHCHIVKEGFQSNISVENALIDMYARCGSLNDACQVFNKISERDVVTWNVMIGGYAQYGNVKDALEIFQQMQCQGVKPDEFTLSSVLKACKHAGLIGEGCHYFDCMAQNHAIRLMIQHHACIVDLLGRAGCLAEATEFISRLPCQPDIVSWMSLLAACRSHGNVELAKQVTNHILKLEPASAAAHVLLSNIFAVSGRWNDQVKVWSMMKYNMLRATQHSNGG